jgi:uncharacterized phage protein gp47/JayE
MSDAFISKTGISALKIGSPLRSLLEAVAQSQLKNSEDIFNLLNSMSLEHATGTALDSIAADEGLVRRNATSAFGYVTFTDVGFTKVETVLAQPTPIGASSIKVKNGVGFATGDKITISLNGIDQEGGINQSAIEITVDPVDGYLFHLNAPLKYAHPANATILRRRGGQRLISPLTSIGDTVLFSTLNEAVIADGETTIEDVPVVCSVAGTAGNVAANSITKVNSALPFKATVTNPLPFSNATDLETDDSLRQRVRYARQVKQKATPLAVTQAIVGVTAPDERKTVVSTQIVDVGEGKASVYIDDGTGYEGTTAAIAFESLTDSASGGEQYFELQGGRPVSKAFVVSTKTDPFLISQGETLEVRVGGRLYTHTFDTATEFIDPSKANVYEVVASINANTDIGFYATTSDDRSKVKLLPKPDVDETIEVVSQGLGSVDTSAFNFPSTPVSTMYLFKNGALLNKDGREAFVESFPISSWRPIPQSVHSVTLWYRLDTSGQLFVTINDGHFAALTVYRSIWEAGTDLDAWCTVLNYLVIGAHFTHDGVRMTFTSNLGRNSRARVVTGKKSATGDLSFYRIFPLATSIGKNSDYTLNRSKGQVFLTDPLDRLDNLIAGSVDIRTPYISTSGVPVTYLQPTQLQAVWFVANDSNASVLVTEMKSGKSVTISYIAASGTQPKLVKIEGVAGDFTDVEVNDWAVVHDAALFVNQPDVSWTKRVYEKAEDSSYVLLVEDGTTEIDSGAKTLTDGGVIFVRSTEIPQRAKFNAYSGYTALQDDLNSQLRGMHCRVLPDSHKLAFYTNSYSTTGCLVFVDATSPLKTDLFQTWNHTPVVNPPDYQQSLVSDTDTSAPVFSHIQASVLPSASSSLLGKINVFTFTENGKLSEQSGFENLYKDTLTYDTTLNSSVAPTPYYTATDYKSIYPGYQISDSDTLSIVLDGDSTNKLYPVSLVVDGVIDQAGNLTLPSFPLPQTPNDYFKGASLKDWAIWQRPTGTLDTAYETLPQDTVLFRSNYFGPNSPIQRLRYVYPSAPDTSMSLQFQKKDVYTGQGTTSPFVLSGVGSIVLPSGSVRVVSIPSSAVLYAGKPDPVTKVQRIYAQIDCTAISNGAGVKINATNFPFIAPTGGSSVTYKSIIVPNNTYARFDGYPTFNPVVTGVNYETSPNRFEFFFGVLDPFTAGQSLKVSFSNSATGAISTFDTIAVGDIVSLSGVPLLTGSNDYGLPNGQYRVAAVDPDKRYIDIVTGATDGLYSAYLDASTAQYFPLADVIVNNTNLNSTDVTVLTSSSARVTRSTEDLHLFSTSYTDGALIDNTNYVSSNDSSYVLSLKDPAATFANGTEIKLVPVTAQNIADSINSSLGNLTVHATSSDYNGNRVELVRTQDGSDKTLEVNGGSASVAGNAPSEAVTYNLISNYPSSTVQGAVSISKDSTDSMVVGNVVKVESVAPKTFPLTNGYSSQFFTVAGEYKIVASTTKFWNLWSDSFTPPAPPALYLPQALLWSIKRTGDFTLLKLSNNPNQVAAFTALFNQIDTFGGFVKIQTPNLVIDTVSGNDVTFIGADIGFNSLRIGDKLICSASTATPIKTITNVIGTTFTLDDMDGVIPGNILQTKYATVGGLYRVLGVDKASLSFWIEEPSAQDGEVYLDTMFLSKESMLPNETFVLREDPQHVTNPITVNGTVEDLGWRIGLMISDYSSATKTIYSTTELQPNSTTVSYGQMSHTRTTNEVTYRTVSSIVMDPDMSTRRYVLLQDFSGFDWFGSPTGGFTLTPQNKLGFLLNSQVKSADAYKYYTGLIGECNKIIYGDLQNIYQYPGYASANANIEVLPPSVKRISVQVVVRMSGGYSAVDTTNAIRSQAASAIISTPVGKDVAFSDIVAAVNSVPGVFSAYVTSLTTNPAAPVYSATNTTISVQANEKAMVINPEQDIQVTFVGVA